MSINYEDYNKISDVMLNLGDHGCLKCVVSLNYLNLSKFKVNFHREVQNNTGFSINRNFQYFYSIEKKTDDVWGNVMIRAQDLILLKRKLAECLKWFDENKTFCIKDNKLIIYPTKRIFLQGLAGNKWLGFEPVVIQYDDSSPVAPGVRITLGDDSIYLDVDVSKFYALVELLETTPLYVVAQNMVNYLGRPDFGTNLYVMDVYEDKETAPKQSTISKAVNGRQIKKNKSFFDLEGDE